MSTAPGGFEVLPASSGELFVLSAFATALRAAGLDDEEGWRSRIAGSPRTAAAGRGAVARLRIPQGTALVMKRLLRGGLAARLWRGHMLGRCRLLRNLSVPHEAIGRGIATPQAVALLLVRAAPGLYRGWLAVEEQAGTRDLGAALSDGAERAEPAMQAALAAVRRAHDRGLVHPDLNLGNLLLAGSSETGYRATLIDLDRARLVAGAVPAASRRRMLQRLERSYVKRFGSDGPFGGEWGSAWSAWYAADDPELARAVDVRRGAGRLRLGLHRAAWSLRPGYRRSD